MNPFLNYFALLGFNRHDVEVLGIKNGYAGLLATARQIESGQSTVASCLEQIDTHPGHAGIRRAEQSVVRLDHESVSGLLSRGGIMLGASRCPEFHDPEARRLACNLLENLGVRALVVCGGDGSIAGASSLASQGSLRVIGVPASIENDVLTTETALGVDTALNTLTWAVTHVADTDVSHHRIMVFEVMGRRRGELARVAGLAAGAQIVVSPQGRGPLTYAQKIQAIAQRLEQGMLEGRRLSIVLVAEGVKLGPSLARHGDSNPTMRLARELQVHFQPQKRLVSKPGSPPVYPWSAPAAGDRLPPLIAIWPHASPKPPGTRSPAVASAAVCSACGTARSSCKTSTLASTPNSSKPPNDFIGFKQT